MLKPAKEPLPNELLRYEREVRYNLSQWELAQKLVSKPDRDAPLEERKEKQKRVKVDEKTVKRWERGVTPIPYYQRQLAKLFNRKAQELGFPEKGIPFWHVPYLQNPFFTGRDGYLLELYSVVECRNQQYHDQKYWSDEQREWITFQPQALVGLSGMGKTQIALEYAYRYQQEYQAIFWLRANSYEVLEEDFADLAEKLNLPEQFSSDPKKRIKAVKEWLTHFTRWLLIFDRADDLRIIRDFLPHQCFGHIIITTQSSATAGLAQAIRVEEMHPQERVVFLLLRSKHIVSAQEMNTVEKKKLIHARQLAELLGGLPLMLDQAGAYIDKGQCSFAKYAREYQAQPIKHLRYLDELGEYYHPYPVAKTFDMNFGEVREVSPVAADLLCLFAFLDPAAIPEEMITNAASELEFPLSSLADDPGALTSALIELRNYSLVQRTAETGMCTIHPTVQMVIRGGMEEEELQWWAGQAVRVVLSALGNAFSQCLTTDTFLIRKFFWFYHRYLPQLYACIGNIKRWARGPGAEAFAQRIHSEVELGNIVLHFLNLVHFLPETEREEAIEMIDESGRRAGGLVLSLLQEIRGGMPALPAIEAETLIVEQEATEPLPRSVGWREKLFEFFEEDEENEVNLLVKDKWEALVNNQIRLGGQFRSRVENDGELASLLQEGADIIQEITGELKNDYISGVDDLVNDFLKQGDNERAEWLLEEAVAFGERFLVYNHPVLMRWYYELASLYVDRQERLAEAEELLRYALNIILQGNPTLQSVSNILNRLGSSYYLQEKYPQAEQTIRNVLSLYQLELGGEHPAVAESLDKLATIFLLQGQYADAIELSEQALDIVQKAFGEQHLDTAGYLHSLGECYEFALAEPGEDLANVTEYREEAKRLNTKALEILEALGEQEHPLAEDIRESLVWLEGIEQ